MFCNYIHNNIHIKLKDKSKINLNNNRIIELFKLSLGNKVYKLNYNIKESLNQNLEIICIKKYISKKDVEMVYANNLKKVKIFDTKFISNNIKKAKIIINHQQYNLKEYMEKKINAC